MAWQGLKNASPGRLASLALGGASGAFLWGSQLHAEAPPKELPHACLRKDDPNRKERVVVLGTGWGAVSVLRSLDTDKYDVWCVSPRNYFLFTPLLPSAAVGTLEGRSVVDSVRRLFDNSVTFVESTCTAIDPLAKTITCQPEAAASSLSASLLGAANPEPNAGSSSRVVVDSTRTRPTLDIQYDKLVVAVGAQVNTFGIPGVSKHAHFLKELPDARRIRSAVSDAFESAAMPDLPKEERKRLLHFVVVGGGPTGVEFAAEMADLVKEDAHKAFPRQCEEDVKISLIEVQDHVLSTFDKRISEYTEKQFKRENINLLTGVTVKAVNSDSVELQDRDSKKVWDEPCSMVVWATGIGVRPVVEKLMETLGPKVQSNRRAITTDAQLAVKGAKDIYAIGDCATIEHPRLLAEIEQLFMEADTDKNSVISLAELQNIIEAKLEDYPQLEVLGDKLEKHFPQCDKKEKGQLAKAEFSELLQKADAGLRMLPPTAQVATQQGEFLGKHLNALAAGNQKAAKQRFRYTHLGSMVYIGDDTAGVDFTGAQGSVPQWLDKIGLGPLGGYGANLLWSGYYWSAQYSMRTRALVAFDWMRTMIFGRDIGRQD
eukprot:jgi/Tetstr1/422854/TSEL_013645.t1